MSGQVISIDQAGVLTGCGGNVTCSGAPQPAKYKLVGTNNAIVTISCPGFNLTGPGDAGFHAQCAGDGKSRRGRIDDRRHLRDRRLDHPRFDDARWRLHRQFPGHRRLSMKVSGIGRLSGGRGCRSAAPFSLAPAMLDAQRWLTEIQPIRLYRGSDPCVVGNEQPCVWRSAPSARSRVARLRLSRRLRRARQRVDRIGQRERVKPLVLTKLQDLDLGTVTLGPACGAMRQCRCRRAACSSAPAPTSPAPARRRSRNITSRARTSRLVRISAPNVTLINQSDSTQTLTLSRRQPRRRVILQTPG